MKYKEDLQQASHLLRLAIPLMVKQEIPPTPKNYALWYEYVADRNEQLNEQLGRILKHPQSFSANTSDELFRQFVINDELEDTDRLKDSLDGMLKDFSEHLGQSQSHTEDYSEDLNKGLEQLQGAQSIDELGPVLKELQHSTDSNHSLMKAVLSHIQETQSELKNIKQELHKSQLENLLDPLTQLYNRKALDKDLQTLPITGSCIAMLDIDHFKAFNDTYGHSMGDAVLRLFSKLLNKHAPQQAYRYGGEEFCLLFPSCSGDEAHAQLETLKAALSKLQVKNSKSGKALEKIRVSFGLSVATTETPAELLLEQADQALYQAKEQGRDRIVVWQE